MSDSTLDKKAEGITWVNAQTLIQLRHQAPKLPLNHSKIHAKQGGAYLSSFKGRGMEYDESRIYLPGDDIRNMDWRVTARTGKAHTKIFQEERERPVLLWLDLNDSMFFATRGAFKSVIAAKIASLLAWCTTNQSDRLGALIFSGIEHIEMRPARGKSSVLNFIGRVCKHPAWGKHNSNQRDMQQALSRLRKVTRPGSLMFLISDFKEATGETLSEQTRSHLANLARHNNVVLIHIHDPTESNLPNAGVYKVSNGKEDVQIDANNKKVKQSYNERFSQHQQALLDMCRKHRMHLISVSTEDDVLDSLQQGLGIQGSHGLQFRKA